MCWDEATPTGVHVDDYTCECEFGFELKSITKNGTTYDTCKNTEDCSDAEFRTIATEGVVACQLLSTMLITSPPVS